MKIAGTDLNLLVAFDALLSEGSVSAAASKIGLSQPAMSKRLSRLRALFQDDLFVRTSDGVKPTERALDLADPIRSDPRCARSRERWADTANSAQMFQHAHSVSRRPIVLRQSLCRW